MMASVTTVRQDSDADRRRFLVDMGTTAFLIEPTAKAKRKAKDRVFVAIVNGRRLEIDPGAVVRRILK